MRPIRGVTELADIAVENFKHEIYKEFRRRQARLSPERVKEKLAQRRSEFIKTMSEGWVRKFASFLKIYIYPRPEHFKSKGGPSAGSPFEQISMQRLTGVPRSIGGGTGGVGSGGAGFLTEGQQTRVCEIDIMKLGKFLSQFCPTNPAEKGSRLKA